MKPYMSYWSGGYRKIPDKFTINMHKVCAYFLKQNFGEVHLITDSESLSFFKNIGYTSITTDLDVVPHEYSSVWSISKLYAYKKISQIGDPFIHVDYDVIIWEKLPERILEANLFAQNLEKYFGPKNSTYDFYEVENVIKYCPNLHLLSKVPKIDEGINVGILGGKDLDFIEKYVDLSLNWILDPENKQFWLSNFFSNAWNKAVIPEQYYLSICAYYYKKEFEFLFQKYWPTPEELSTIKYTHLMGEKRLEETPLKIKKLVEKLNL
jgi:hypothetical protein